VNSVAGRALHGPLDPKGEIETIEGMEERSSREVMEGGMSPDVVLRALNPETRTLEDVFSYAMMLETQALDLLLRFSQRSEDEQTTGALVELAHEEKAHLKALGELLDKRAR